MLNLLRFFVLLLLCGCSSMGDIGHKNGQLQPCPGSPNCINSQIKGKSHVQPILYPESLSEEQVTELLIKIILSMPRMRLIQNQGKYLHFESRTFLGFVDDIELYIENETKKIHIRSASRVGYYDFKKNYNRYIKIKNLLEVNFSQAAE